MLAPRSLLPADLGGTAMTSVLRGAALLRCAVTAGSLLCQRTASGFLVAGAVVCVLPSLAHGDIADATSQRAARQEATRAIPWRQMAPEHRRSAQFVVNHTSIYRRLPTRIIDCDPDLFSFLVRHPEVVIDVWRTMGLSQVALEKLPADIDPGAGSVYRGTDGAGTTGTVRFLYADWGLNARNLAVVFAEGAYEGKPVMAPIKAQSLILLRSGAIQETNGRHYVTVRVDSFVHIEQVGVELVAKTIQPWISKTADHNFIETLSFVSNFSRTAEQNPNGIERLAARLPSIDEPTRNELVALSFRTAERYARQGSAGMAPTLVAQRLGPAVAHAKGIAPAASATAAP